ncbi:DUF3017 domain-containing protein [Nonomuraea sp. NPDC050536]|uniref:DUF3017 domain-containing protein n=1 Tax=Nonomuraea sp. NPDC050536 TaxID=3364366 RepID=UPI0037C58CDB
MNDSKRESWGPYPLILAGAVVSVAVIFLIDPRWGGFALGAVLMIAAALRFAGYGGQLAVRSKRADMIVMGLGGFAVVLTSLILGNDTLKAMILNLLGG